MAPAAHTLDLSVLPAERRRFLAGVGRRLSAQALARREPERRHPILLTLLTQSAADVQMLEDAFAESVRTHEPGGRIGVNVANLGRRPYRSLSADVTGILQDRLGLLLRGRDHLAQGPGLSPAGTSRALPPWF